MPLIRQSSTCRSRLRRWNRRGKTLRPCRRSGKSSMRSLQGSRKSRRTPLMKWLSRRKEHPPSWRSDRMSLGSRRNSWRARRRVRRPRQPGTLEKQRKKWRPPREISSRPILWQPSRSRGRRWSHFRLRGRKSMKRSRSCRSSLESPRARSRLRWMKLWPPSRKRRSRFPRRRPSWSQQRVLLRNFRVGRKHWQMPCRRLHRLPEMPPRRKQQLRRNRQRSRPPSNWQKEMWQARLERCRKHRMPWKGSRPLRPRPRNRGRSRNWRRRWGRRRSHLPARCRLQIARSAPWLPGRKAHCPWEPKLPCRRPSNPSRMLLPRRMPGTLPVPSRNRNPLRSPFLRRRPRSPWLRPD